MDASAIDRLQEAANIDSANNALTRSIDEEIQRPHASVALPPGWTLHDAEAFAEGRRRQRGMLATSDVKSLVSYVDGHLPDGSGAFAFVDADRMAATVVLDLRLDDGSPGHCDHTVQFKARATAEYTAWTSGTDAPKSQRDLAEWMEDWGASGALACTDADGTEIPLKQAISAIRQISIEGLRKVETTERQMSTQRSAFESIEATSPNRLPSRIAFTCQPYIDLPTRTFEARLSIITGDKAPTLVLRRVLHPQHVQAMADELRTILTAAMPDSVPVLLGTWAKS